jgi:hypothetical protein
VHVRRELTVHTGEDTAFLRKARDGSVDWKVLSTHALEQLRRR